MRSVGLAALLVSVLLFLFPYYREWVPFIHLPAGDLRIYGAMLLALGGVTLLAYRNQ